MILLARLIHTAFGIYTLGLIIYSLLSWMHTPETIRLRNWLGRYYTPLLRPLQQRIRPILIGGTAIDLSTLILLVILTMLKSLVIRLLIPSF